MTIIRYSQTVVDGDVTTTIDSEDNRSVFSSVAQGVQSFNTREGGITLTNSDVDAVLGFTPAKDSDRIALYYYQLTGNNSGGFTMTATLGAQTATYAVPAGVELNDAVTNFALLRALNLTGWFPWPVTDSRAVEHTQGILAYETIGRGYKATRPTMTITNTGGSTVAVQTITISTGGTP